MSQTEQSRENESVSVAHDQVHNEGQADGLQNIQDGNATRGRKRKTSTVWSYFEECTVPSKKERGKIENKVKCKACGALLARNSCGTTSSMKRHLDQCDYFKHQQKSKQQKIINFPSIDEENFNILHRWSMNELKYPIVSKLAKDDLTIPITTVSSESAFSTGGRVVDDYRSSLLPSMVEALVCASSWIRRGHHKTMDLEDDSNSIPLI